MGIDEHDNAEFVKAPQAFVIRRDVSLALRELHRLASSLRFWAGLAAVVLVLAVAAPFDTDTHFTFPLLLVYWAAIATGTFFSAMGTALVVSRLLVRRGWSPLIADLSGSVLAGVPVTAFVVLFNRLFFSLDPIADHGLLRFFVQCLLITMATFAVFHLVEGRDSQRVHTDVERDRPVTESTDAGDHAGDMMDATALHQRLPADIGTDVVSLQAQDHYVDVTTTDGHVLLLMRLADAMREIQPLPGLRVHRSWWIAERHMVSLSRQGSRHVLALSNAATVPVSRSHVEQVRTVLAARQSPISQDRS